jgi:hypothetical protein
MQLAKSITGWGVLYSAAATRRLGCSLVFLTTRASTATFCLWNAVRYGCWIQLLLSPVFDDRVGSDITPVSPVYSNADQFDVIVTTFSDGDDSSTRVPKFGLWVLNSHARTELQQWKWSSVAVVLLLDLLLSFGCCLLAGVHYV